MGERTWAGDIEDLPLRIGQQQKDENKEIKTMTISLHVEIS
jgi:hypothetical protein